ncbi:ADP-ribosylglycohydrolase family protein [Mogibacterium neglectum]|uniref:ADP-ribosylglycohydrolase family protein n=1 Tax=Mogibacterium neglectum TaxID=114528 RepID=UPI00272D5BFD|nr:ADP-ribosylglycohydrolase family protein [Mogibacterium neglectum]WLD75705.1 ADP-ribosylglycohydrolase family protein [Mogibacterium neglectum]
MYNKILGCLVGAAAGDAMGAATEARSSNQIIDTFGGKVTEFIKPPNDTFGAGNQAGGFTDDFSSAYFVAKEIVDNVGVVNEEIVQNALVEWSKHAVFFDRFAGPTTRLAIKRFAGEEVQLSEGIKNKARQATNGAAMRISPIGLINAGDTENAIKDAVIVASVTHNNNLAISGACAVAAAVSEAVRDGSNLYDVIDAGIYGANEGEKIGKANGNNVAGPSVVKRIKMAVDIGFGTGSIDERICNIADIIGTGLHVSETVPTAFGIIAACSGDSMRSISEAASIGYDTDTIATIVGGIVGALNGYSSFPDYFISTMENVNKLDILGLANAIYDLQLGKEHQ